MIIGKKITDFTIEEQEKICKYLKVKKYYILELDQFNQPNGMINIEFLTETQKNNTSYVFENYNEALRRALN